MVCWRMNSLLGSIISRTPFVSDSALDIYKNIIRGQVEYPEFMNEQLRDLIEKILVADTATRYGCKNVS